MTLQSNYLDIKFTKIVKAWVPTIIDYHTYRFPPTIVELQREIYCGKTKVLKKSYNCKNIENVMQKSSRVSTSCVSEIPCSAMCVFI